MRIFKLIPRQVLWLLACVGFTACAPTILKYKDVQDFSVTENSTNSKTHLIIRGLVFHSALGVKNVQVRQEGDQVIFEVVIAPAGQNLSGRFEYNLELPDNAVTVVFGEERYPIWRR